MKHRYLLPLCLLLTSPALAQMPATFAPAVMFNAGFGGQPYDMAVADVNGDGKLDVVTADSGGDAVAVLLGTGTGGFGYFTIFNLGYLNRPHAILAADMNGDDRLDVLTANTSASTVSVLLGTGTGSFGLAASFTTGPASTTSYPQGLAVADVNADGWPDIITANSGTSTVSILLGTGTGTSFGAATTYSTGTGSQPYSVAVTDVNADGLPDVLTANTGTGTVGVLLGTSTGTFGAVTTYGTGAGSQPYGLAVADVLATAGGTNTVAVLLGTGTGTFGAVTTYSTGSSTASLRLVVADANGDGKPDVLAANSYSSSVGVLLGTGTGTFGPVTTYSTAPGGQPFGLALADVNGDGKPDLLTANYYSSDVGVRLNATLLPTRAALPGASATLAPNPARTSATFTATGLPTAARTVAATVLDATGRPISRLTLPAALGAAMGSVPTAGLAAGLYLLRLNAIDAQGADLGALPTQRLSVE